MEQSRDAPETDWIRTSVQFLASEILQVVSVAKRDCAIRDDIETRKKSVRYDELVDLLEAAGFSLARWRGSHRTFTKPGCPVIVTLKDAPGHVRIGHVTTALASVVECGDD